MLHRISGLIFFTFCLATPAFALQETVQSAYERYNEALAANDFAAADAAAETAWRLSEESAGPSKQTAVLAYNLAWMRALRGNFGEALEPAERAYKLAKDYPDAGVNPMDAALVVGVSRAKNRDSYEFLHGTLEQAYGGSQADPDLLGLGYKTMAENALAEGDFLQAAAYAREGLKAGGEALSQPTRLDLLLLRASALTISRYPIQAAEVFQQASEYLDPQPLGDWNSRALHLRAWSAVNRALLTTYQEQLSLSDDEIAEMTGMFYEETVPEICRTYDLEWERELPDYPRDMLRKGGFGAAVMEYDIDAAGRVVDARIVYSVPDSAYDETALEAARQWRLVSPVPPEECRNDLLLDLTYVIGGVEVFTTGSRLKQPFERGP